MSGGEFSPTVSDVHISLQQSLGTIVWECFVGGFPFSTPPPAAEDKSHIRRKLAEGALPWDIDGSQEMDHIYSIVRDCWNANPTLRPSAAFVSQTLLDIVVRELVPASPAIFIPHNTLYAIKERVLEGIKGKKEGTTQLLPIVPDDVRILRQSADLGIDPVSSYLLGAAILCGLIPAHLYDQVVDEYTSIEPHPEGMVPAIPRVHLLFHTFDSPVKRMRGALKYLEIAVDAGKEEALHECGKAHYMLAKHYVGK